MRHFLKTHTTVREIACRLVFLAKLYGANGSFRLPWGHPSPNPQAQNTYTTQVGSAGRKKSTPLWLGPTQEIVFIELGRYSRMTLRKNTTRQLRARRQGGEYRERDDKRGDRNDKRNIFTCRRFLAICSGWGGQWL